jgi:nucleoside-diphosphate-sugar epimerase
MIEKAVGVSATKHDTQAHSAELPQTFADTTHAQQQLDYHPKVTTSEGVAKFTAWFQWYLKASETKVIPSRETYLPAWN